MVALTSANLGMHAFARSTTPAFVAANHTLPIIPTLPFRQRRNPASVGPTHSKGSLKSKETMFTPRLQRIRWATLLTKMLTSMTLLGVGDVLEQCRSIQEQHGPGSFSKHFELMRTVRQSTYGFCFAAPMCHFWYPVLERIIPLAGDKLEWFGRAFARVILDQALSPLNLATFVGWMTFWEEGSMENVWKRVAHAVPELLPKCLVYWIPVHLVTFSVIPDDLRVLYIGLMAILWGVILSAFKSGQLEALLRSVLFVVSTKPSAA